jgi:hypothetical protein
MTACSARQIDTLTEKPITVTAARSSRSAGGPRDFFSEADSW